jgi:hypothetical protein
MNRRELLKATGLAAIGTAALAGAGCSSETSTLLGNSQIQHGVIFTLMYEKGSAEAAKFINDGKRILSAIPTVKDFHAFEQVSPKNDYQYGFTMVFDSDEDYKAYNDHPDHVDFVENRWKKEVTDFLEIDFRNF